MGRLSGRVRCGPTKCGSMPLTGHWQWHEATALIGSDSVDSSGRRDVRCHNSESSSVRYCGRRKRASRPQCCRNRKSSPERGGAPTGRRGPKFGTGGAGGELGPLRRFAPPPRSGEDWKGQLSTREHSWTNDRNVVGNGLSADKLLMSLSRHSRPSFNGKNPSLSSCALSEKT